MGFWAQLTEQAKKMWAAFTSLQKVVIASVLAVAFLGITGLIFVSLFRQPALEPLYTNLDPIDASAIAAKLKELKVEYQLADEGRTILVDKKDKYQLRLDMAGQVNLRGTVGFETFNETRFGETDTDKRVRFLVALQGELTRTIEELDEVESAKVHIALPTPSLFIKEQEESTASVLLRLKPYARLKPEQVQSVMAFVSNSVEGLKPENVTIIDVNGNLLSEGLGEGSSYPGSAQITSSQLAMKQKYEKELAASIQSMLERMRGPGKAVVRANVEMDFDQVEVISETYGDAILLSEQVKEETSTGQAASPGNNPADSNMGGTTYGEGATNGSSEYSLLERTRNYEPNKTVETKIVAPGKISRLSVAVLLDGELSAEDEGRITQAVNQAAGIDTSRGDQVSLVAMPFNTEYSDSMLAAMSEAEKREARREYIRYGLLGLVIIACLATGYFILRKLLSVLANQKLAGPIRPALQGAAEVDIPITISPEAQEKKNIRTQIENLAEVNPEEIAKVIKTWLIEE